MTFGLRVGKCMLRAVQPQRFAYGHQTIIAY